MSPVDSPPASPAQGVDGRRTRWEAHRRTRRDELVTATLRAVRQHGAGVGMDEIAAAAGTSKTVLYRHFGDRTGLYLAAAARVDRTVRRELAATLTATDDPRELIAAAVDGYLRLVEGDPEVYRFVVHRPLLDRPLADRPDVADPVSGLTGVIADHLSRALIARLRLAGVDEAARIWSHALVGAVRAAAERWSAAPASDRVTRVDLGRHLTDLIWTGLGPALSAPTSSPAEPEEQS